MVVDPVCGMNVNPYQTEWKTEYEGKSYYFCSEFCLKTFNKNPQKYVEKEQGGCGCP